MMIEPTETESPETLDIFAEAMLRYARLAASDPESLKALPNLRVKHLDESGRRAQPERALDAAGGRRQTVGRGA